jgi:hypothetical protein
MIRVSFVFAQSVLIIGALCVDRIQSHPYPHSFLRVEELQPSVSCLCNASTISKNSAYFFLWILFARVCFASHQLERASPVIFKVEYDLRTKEFKHACQKKMAKSYSTDRQVDVQNRAAVSLPTIGKHLIDKPWIFDNDSSLVFLAVGVKRYMPFNCSN